MNAIILAAGRGSRMKEMTASKPKCLLELAQKTLLEWQTEALSSAGVNTITIVRGYLKEKLVSPNYQYIDNPEWATSNMVASLLCAHTILAKAPSIVSYSDIVYHPSIISALASSSGDISITYDQIWDILWGERFANPLDDAETFEVEGGRLKTIGRKPTALSEVKGQYMGLLKITPKGWEKISEYLSKLPPERINKLDMTSLLRALIENDVPISAVPIRGKWCEVDREEDFRLYEQKLSTSKWVHDWRQKR